MDNTEEAKVNMMARKEVLNPESWNQEQMSNGTRLVVQYLGSTELSGTSRTAQDLANVILRMHNMYRLRKKSLRDTAKVLVCIDSEKILVKTNNDLDIFLAFSLVNVQEITTCLDRLPYSRTSVLVARESDQHAYTAYLFYSKTAQHAIDFYRAISSAFHNGVNTLIRGESCSNDSHTHNSYNDRNDCFDSEKSITEMQETQWIKDTHSCEPTNFPSRRIGSGKRVEFHKKGIMPKLKKSNNKTSIPSQMEITELIEKNDETNSGPIVEEIQRDLSDTGMEDDSAESSSSVMISNSNNQTKTQKSRHFGSHWSWLARKLGKNTI